MMPTREEWLAIGLAIVGGLVRAIGCKEDEFTVWGCCQRILSAIFIGVIAMLILRHGDMTESMKTAIAGGAGYAANDLLTALKPWVRKRLGL
jgi:hypothetical protein